MSRVRFDLPRELELRVEKRLADWQEQDVARRLRRKDPTLWRSSDTPELANRLGWVDLPSTSKESLQPLLDLADAVTTEDIRHVVVLGMGGSSLAPEVVRQVWRQVDGFPLLSVLDSTHPLAVHELAQRTQNEPTLFFVSSKSGTTIETLTLFRFFWHRIATRSEEPGRSFVAVTDPGSPLEELANELGFRTTLLAPPDVGGRYSALSPFGLGPAAVMGVGPDSMLDSALCMERDVSMHAETHAVFRLGAVLSEGAQLGYDKVTLLTSETLRAFPLWVEQLLAESLGKDGKGLIPVAGESIADESSFGPDRLFVFTALEEDPTESLKEFADALRAAGRPVVWSEIPSREDLGGEFLLWETATALAGAGLGIHPFDQPDVELAKNLAREVMGRDSRDAPPIPTVDLAHPEPFHVALAELLDSVAPGDFIALQAFLPPHPETDFALHRIRERLRSVAGIATTTGYGPRFLHSSGQLHKGGPNSGVFLQLVDQGREDLAVPDRPFTFRELLNAQSDGDALALLQRGRRFLRIRVGGDPAHGLARLVAALSGTA